MPSLKHSWAHTATSVCSSLLPSSTRISTGKPHNVVFADNEANLIFGCSPQKRSAGMQEGVLGSKTQTWLQLILLAIFTTQNKSFTKNSDSVCAGQQSPTSEQTDLVVQRDIGAALHFQYRCNVNKALLPFYQTIKLCVGIPLELNNRPENKFFLVSCQSSVKHTSQKDSPRAHCWNTCFKRTNMFSQSFHQNVSH